MGDYNRIQKLVVQLRSPKERERFEACEWLRALPETTPEAIQALREALNDPNEDVRYSAESALKVHLPDYSVNKNEKINIKGVERTMNAFSVPEENNPNTFTQPSSKVQDISVNSPEYNFILEKKILVLEIEMKQLSKELSQLQIINNSLVQKIPKTRLLSDDYLTRAFAVFGHQLVAGLIISIPLTLLYFLFFGILIANLAR